jgi:hypothetical protein
MIRRVHRFEELVGATGEGPWYVAEAYAGEREDGRWDGWLVFLPLDRTRPLPTERETTQPTGDAVEYWASGLTPVYLEGALARAIAMTPEARLQRRVIALDREEATKKAEAEAYARAALEAHRAAEVLARTKEADLRALEETEERPRAARPSRRPRPGAPR